MNKFLPLIILFSSFAWVQLLHPSEYYDSDEKLAPLFRLAELDRCISEGVFPVRWAPDTYGGRGSPFFNFYAPLFYYLAEIPVLLGFSIIWSVKIAIALIFVFSGIFMFFLMREVAGERAGFFSALLYMYSPYLLFDIYVRGSLGEALAMALAPSILFALHKRAHIVGGFAYAALLMSHNALALLFTPFLILYMAYTVRRKELPLANALLIILFGFGFSTFFWLPALWEKSAVYIEWILLYDYRSSFRDIVQIASPLGYFARATIENKSSLQLGALHAALALSAYPLLRTTYSKFVLSMFLLSVFLMTRYSTPVWAVLPLVKYVQFPWRAMSIAALFSAILGGLALGSLVRKLDDRWLPIFGLVIVISSFNFVGYAARIEVTNENTTAAKLKEYYDSGLTYGHDYLPRGAIVPSRSIVTKSDAMEGNVLALERREGCADLALRVEGGGKVRIYTNWFPGWRAYVDGKDVDIQKDGEGLMILGIPTGIHDVRISFEDTRVRSLANLISLLSLFVAAILYRKWR